MEDQQILLQDALTIVRQQTALMRKCLETPGKLMDALKCRCVQLKGKNFHRRRKGETDGRVGVALRWCRNFEQARWDPNNITSFTWLSLML